METRFETAVRLRRLAWGHIECDRFDVADLLFRRAFELEHTPTLVVDTRVIL
ncbi:MAG: hypothetical protein ACYC6C_10315 [Coriobacteriia bacterium]